MARVVWSAEPDTWMASDDDLHGDTLFVLSAHSTYRYVAIVIDGGFRLDVNGGLGDLLPQLGWPEDLATWAAEPRTIDDAQAAAMWSMLRMVRPSDTTCPELVEDATLAELRAAVWVDPASDACRMVYADALLDRGDPRGELISLQIERARCLSPPTSRRASRSSAASSTSASSTTA